MKAPPPHDRERVIGVISDTHGLLRPEALDALAGVDLIVHAGDVGGSGIIEGLASIAPVSAVRGNTDYGDAARALPPTRVVEVGDTHLYVIHDLLELDIEPATAGMAAVISGHSHRPLIEDRGGVLFLNPGSAGPRRFDLPVTVARIHLRGGKLEPRLIELDV